MDVSIWIYTLASVTIVSLVSFIGIITLSMSPRLLQNIVVFLVSFAAGSMFGGAFFHLLPEAAKDGFSLAIAVKVLGGLIIFFMLEKFIHWRHCHLPTAHNHPHPMGMMNLIGDGFHNFTDGIVIAGAYIASIPVGIATSIAVLVHEVPQEIGDFGVLLHAGYEKKKALLYNFISALAAVVGAILALVIGSKVAGFSNFILPFAAGGFIYIAGSDLLPTLHKECSAQKSVLQFLALILGAGVMLALTLIR